MVKGPEIHSFIFLPSFFQVVFLLLQYPNMVVFDHQQNYKKQTIAGKREKSHQAKLPDHFIHIQSPINDATYINEGQNMKYNSEFFHLLAAEFQDIKIFENMRFGRSKETSATSELEMVR